MARQLEALFAIEGVQAARVVRFDAIHQAGRPFMVDLEVVMYEYSELDVMIGKAASLSFGAIGEEPRAFFGIVEAATVIGSTAHGVEERGVRYALRVVSRLALLARSVDSRIYQDQTVKDIIADVLARHGVDKVEWRLTASYDKREYCVQYQESALAFVSRLCEHEGIYSFVEPSDDGELLVFADDAASAGPMKGDPELPLRPRSSMADGADAVYALRQEQRVRSGKFVLRDFDFKRPSLDLTSTGEAKERTALEVYDYPGFYVEPAEGKRLAKVRLEEEQVLRRTVTIEACCPRIAVGQTLTIADAGDAGGEYFVFAVTHRFVHQGAGGERAGSDRPGYVARARLLPKGVPYRPARTTPIPAIEGPQTAIVVAPAGSPVETIHTDKHARCKVKFHWDRSGIEDDKASCWMRVSQLQTSGSMMLPRIGWEVIVEFLEGHPDRPIVTGRLYNGENRPPYALPEGKTRTAIKTSTTPGGGGSNEIRLEDKAGSEEIMIHAQHDMKVVAANNAKKTIGHNETSDVGNNAKLEVGADQTTKITKGTSNTIGGNQTVDVTGDRKVEVNAVTALTAHGAGTIKVGGDQFEMDGNPLEALLALAAQAAEEFVASMADNAIARVQAHVDGAINQVMGPINQLNSQIQGVQRGMEAVANGDLSGVAGMAANASGIPGASQLASRMAPPPAARAGGISEGGGGAEAGRGGGGAEAGRGGGAEAGRGGGAEAGRGGAEIGRGGAEAGGAAEGGGSPTNPLASMATSAAHSAIHQGIGAAHNALASALGLGGAGGGGQSGANVMGPPGDVPGVDQTDRVKGPGHSTAMIKGAHTEKVGSMKITASIKAIDTNVKGDKKVDVGAATVQLAIGSYSETGRGQKTESALGLVVLSKGGESEQVKGSKTCMVGGAIVDKLKGSHAIQAKGPATFIGAFHKIEAKESITFKCGASSVVIDSSGVTIKAPIVAILAPKIQLPNKVTEL